MTTTPTIERATLKVRECASLLGISETMCYEQLNQGHIPALRLGGKWIICKATILRMLENAPAIPITKR